MKLRKNRVPLSILAVFALLALPSSADAQPRVEERDGVRILDPGGSSARDVEYQFRDDPLAAGNLGPRGGAIVVPRRAFRVTLIRPRLHFIPELLKSVENL